MKTFNNFAFYTPENGELTDGILYLRSDSGLDWYEAQAQFAVGTIKIMYDAGGRICCVETDPSGMWPVDCSVAEIPPESLPAGFALNGDWVLSGGAVVKYQPSQKEISAYAAREKSRLLSVAAAALTPLQNAADLGMATEAESAALIAWKKYSVFLNRVDTLKAPDIEWPVMPV